MSDTTIEYGWDGEKAWKYPYDADVVSYPGFFAKGEHGAEKHMTYYGEQTIAGISFPRSIKTYKWDGKTPTEHTTNITISEVSFRPDTRPEYFSIPEGSRVMDGYKFDE